MVGGVPSSLQLEYSKPACRAFGHPWKFRRPAYTELREAWRANKQPTFPPEPGEQQHQHNNCVQNLLMENQAGVPKFYHQCWRWDNDENILCKYEPRWCTSRKKAEKTLKQGYLLNPMRRGQCKPKARPAASVESTWILPPLSTVSRTIERPGQAAFESVEARWEHIEHFEANDWGQCLGHCLQRQW